MPDKDQVNKEDDISGSEGESGRKIYVLRRDNFEIWCDPRNERRINQFNDDDGFIVEGGDIKFPGRNFKSRNFREMVLDSIRERRDKEDYERSWYPNVNDKQVYLARDRPRVYLINARFEPARVLAVELGMPIDEGTHYLVCHYTGALFKRGNARYENYKKYSLEIFGLSVDLPSPPLDPLPWRVPLPDPALYKTEPTYYWWNGFSLVQVWRRRVFPCPVEELRSSLAEPLSPREPQTLFMEERWHPDATDRRVTVGGPDHIATRMTALNRFQTDAFGILNYQNRKGRKRGSKKFRSKEAFIKAGRKAYGDYMDLMGERPNQLQLADQMGISEASFYNYMNEHQLIWDADLKPRD
jgi:hypothetical protein